MMKHTFPRIRRLLAAALMAVAGIWSLAPHATLAQEAAAPLTLTVGQALELARENSHRIRQADADVRRAELATREAAGGRLPTVSVDGQYTNNIQSPVIVLPPGSPFGDVLRTGSRHNFNAAAQARMPLFSAQLNQGIALSRAAEALNRELLTATTRQVEVEVQRAFLNGLMTREALAVLRTSLETRAQNLALVRSLYDEGIAPEYDVIRTDVQVQNLQPDVVRAENQHVGALNYLRLLTGIPMEQPVELAGTLTELHATVPEVVFVAEFSQNVNVVQVEGQREIARRQVSLERAAHLPTLAAFGNYVYQGQGNDLRLDDYNWINTSGVGLSVSIPIFDGFQRRRRVQQAEVALDQVEMQREFLEESLLAEFENTANRIQEVERTIDAQARNVAQAERGHMIARVSYENGVQSLVEVNDAELALTQARLNHVNALYDYINAVLDMEDLLGRSITPAP